MKLLALLAALVCAALPAWAVPVSVTVVGPDDKPLPGAKLSSFETKYTLDEPGAMREQTGAGGVFAWEWDGDFADSPAAEKRFLRVRAEAPGMAPQIQVIRQGQTTIALQRARVWGGLVLGPDKKPVAGVALQLESVVPPEQKSDLSKGLSSTFIALENGSAVTDANGRWSVAGLPAQGAARIKLDGARFVKATFLRDIGEGEAEPILVRPGATLTGVLLAPDGTPVEGETVRADFGVGVQTTTDAAGRFTLAGLEPGETTPYIGQISFVTNRKKELPRYVYQRPDAVKVEAGKTTDMGTLKALNGLLIKARIVGADTKKPLPAARFRIGYSDITSVTDENGLLQSRILPSRMERGFDRPTIESAGYVDHDIAPATLNTKDEVLDLGTIEMQRGTEVRGTVALQGEGAENVTRWPGLSLSKNGRYEFINTQSDGSFASPPLSAGSYNLNLNGGQKDWQIVSPRTVRVPAAGEPLAPLEVVVKRLTPFLPLIKEARGRITDAQGQGVAGVTVRARMMFEGGGAYSNATATSDRDGAYTLVAGDNIVGVEIEGADHPDYLIGGPAQVEVKGGIATIAGLVAKTRGAVFAGRVVDGDGKPADKAWVIVVEARDYEPVQTGPDGRFQLSDVPLDKFTLLAARGTDWTKQAVQASATQTTLRLRKSGAPVDAAEALARVLAIKTGVDSNALFAAWDILGAENIEGFIGRNGPPNPEVLALFGAQLSRRDPAQFMARAPQLLAAAQGEARENLEAQLNLLRAGSGDEGDRVEAANWLGEQQRVKREITGASVTRLLQMAALAQKLKRDDAAQWLDYAAALSAQLGARGGDFAAAWSVPLGALGTDATAQLAEEQKAPATFDLWAYVASALARRGDVAGARRALARLEELSRDPEIIKSQNPQNWKTSARRLDEVRQSLAVALAPTDALAALEVAGQIKDAFIRARALTQLADAAGQGNPASAEKALREVMKARIGNVEYFALAASVGAQISPQLGEELFAIAKDKATPDPRRTSFSPPSIGAWAFYHAALDPALSRVTIEREWDWRLPAARKNKDDGGFSDFRSLYELVKGMAAIDPARATEMQAAADAIETKNYGREVSQFDIAVTALATPAQRARMGVDSR